MKKMIGLILLTVLTASFANARSVLPPLQAKHRFTVALEKPENAAPSKYMQYQAFALRGGMVQIVATIADRNMKPISRSSVRFAKLAKDDAANVEIGLKILQNEVIVDEKFMAVCEMYVSREMYDNHLYIPNWKGVAGLKMVSSPLGCWTGHNVYPKSEKAKAVVKWMKDLLRKTALTTTR